MFEKYSHILWDWNGTLIDDVELCIDVGNNLFKSKNIPTITKEKYKSIFTIPVKDYYIAAGFDFSKDSFEEISKVWMSEYESRKYECNLHEGILDTMKKIKTLGIPQSILSAYNQDSLNKAVKNFGLDKYLEYIVGLDNIYAESKLKLGLDLMRKIENGQNKILFIGDTVHDYEVAKEMGIDCVLIAQGHQSKEKLLSCGAPVFNSIKELII